MVINSRPVKQIVAFGSVSIQGYIQDFREENEERKFLFSILKKKLWIENPVNKINLYSFLRLEIYY